MSLRAPEPEPAPFEAEHTVVGHWEAGRLWLAMQNGKVIAETSNPDDDVFRAALAAGAVSYQQKRFIPADHYWVLTDPPTPKDTP
jgi:hypothetical protein